MKLKRPKRNYIMPDSAMVKTGDALVDSAVRDVLLLTPFGYNEAKLETIRLEIKAFKNLPPDIYFIAQKMIATGDCKKAIADMGRAARGVLQRATLKYKKNQSMLDSFGLKGYSKLVAGEKIAACAVTLDQGIKKLDELAAEGLTIEILNTLEGKIAVAKEAMVNKNMRTSDRNIAASTRIEMGNNLHSILAMLAYTGKGIHADTNESLYNDYLIYERKYNKVKKKAKKKTKKKAGKKAA